MSIFSPFRDGESNRIYESNDCMLVLWAENMLRSVTRSWTRIARNAILMLRSVEEAR